MLKRLLSYLYPIRILRKPSDVSQSLELTYVNGKLLLDSENANYSYGSLQRVLFFGLQQIGFEKIREMNDVLVLGVAGGSVIESLDEIKFRGRITGVEIDAEVIEIARKYYNLDRFSNLEIVVADASEFMRSNRKKYDLIIIDVFTDRNMPMFLYDEDFVDSVLSSLQTNGFILFNTIVLDDMMQQLNNQYCAHVRSRNYSFEVLPRQETYNELIVVKN